MVMKPVFQRFLLCYSVIGVSEQSRFVFTGLDKEKRYYINCRVILHLFSFKGNEYYLDRKIRDLFTVSDAILLGDIHSKHYNKCMRKIKKLMSNNSEVFVS